MEVPMQDKCMRCGAPPSNEEEDKQAEQAVMHLLLEDRGLFTVGEVVNETGGKVLPAADAIARLKRAGLVHEFGSFVFASRAAVVSAELWGDA
jgi:hypothetical protein